MSPSEELGMWLLVPCRCQCMCEIESDSHTVLTHTSPCFSPTLAEHNATIMFSEPYSKNRPSPAYKKISTCTSRFLCGASDICRNRLYKCIAFLLNDRNGEREKEQSMIMLFTSSSKCCIEYVYLNEPEVQFRYQGLEMWNLRAEDYFLLLA